MDIEMRKEFAKDLPDGKIDVFTEYIDGNFTTTFRGKWSGSLVKAAIRSIERGYQSFKHTVTKEAARERMRVSVNGGREDGR